MTGLLLVLALAAPPLFQELAPAAPTQPAPIRLNGVWDINKDLSTKPIGAPGDRQGGDSGRGGGRPGGGGSMPGGGGGRGGGMRGGGGGGSRGGGNAEDMRKARDMMQELGQAPARLTVISRSDAVTVTDPEGVVRKFIVDGKTSKVAMNGSTIEVKSKWDGEVLKQEFKAGPATFIRTLETTTDGHQLVVTITPKGDGGGLAGPSFLRFVYDHSQLQY